MPQNVPLTPGATANLGAGQAPGNLTVNAGAGQTLTVAVGGAPAVAYGNVAGGVFVIPVNGAAATVTNTTAGAGGTILLSY